MAERTLTCKQCSATYTVTHQRRSLYCSGRCRSRWQEAHRGPRPGRPSAYPHRCSWCGDEFMGWHRAKYCSPDCQKNAVKWLNRSCPVPWKQCPTCEDWRVGRGPSVYCSEFCLRVALGHRQRATPIEYGGCQRCGGTFIRRAGKVGAFCSIRCAKATAKRNRKHIQRSRTTVGDRITLQALGDRDGWSCHLCGKRVTHRPGNRPGSPSMDHLIPLSAGGEHAWSNVALAHRSCNSQRGTNGAAQLRLRLIA